MPTSQNLVKNTCDVEYGEWGMVSCVAHDNQNARQGSGSSQTSQSCSSGDICRICHCESDTLNPLLAPCYCSGSLKYVHQSCLQQWLTASDTRTCELCKFSFIMHTKIKPFNEWKRLEMSGIERRRLCCAVLFHCVAALCVIWSLFVLIDRAAEEVQRGQIEWPFWTKLVVVAVGFTGGAVFMYIQCRQYLHLCGRWRSHNRILLIQNAPERLHIVSPSPVLSKKISLGAPSRQQAVSQRLNFGQVVANIENNPSNQGRVIQNNEDSESGENESCVESSRDPTRILDTEAKNTTSVFLENRDILGESRLTSHEGGNSTACYDKISTAKGNYNRRYSDTKLLQNFNTTNLLGVPNAFSYEIAGKLAAPNSYVKNSNVAINISSANENDKKIQSTSKTDALQLTIKQIIEFDSKSINNKRSILSLDSNDKEPCEKLNTVFKSLPNLSSSSENLLP